MDTDEDISTHISNSKAILLDEINYSRLIVRLTWR
jgi:hypothetical protein